MSSLSIDAVAAAQAVRRHWEIENNLHWVLDVVFREDEMTISAQNGAAHVALFNRVALGIIKQHTGKKDSMVAKRRYGRKSAARIGKPDRRPEYDTFKLSPKTQHLQI